MNYQECQFKRQFDSAQFKWDNMEPPDYYEDDPGSYVDENEYDEKFDNTDTEDDYYDDIVKD